MTESRCIPLFSLPINIEGPTAEEIEKLEKESRIDDVLAANQNMSPEDISIIQKYISEIQKFKLLVADDEIRLAKLIQENKKEAEYELLTSNLRLVISIAKRYFRDDYRTSLLDLIQEGNIGLSIAVKKFDNRRGCRFATYATWWIKKAITEELNKKTRTIYIPAYILTLWRQYNRELDEMTLALKRIPTTREVAKKMGVDKNALEDAIKHITNVSSLNCLLSDNSDSDELGDIIEDKRNLPLEERMDLMEFSRNIQKEIKKLSKKEQEFFVYRFLDGHSDKKVAKKLNIPEKEVKKIIDQIRAKFKKSPELLKFRELIKK